MTDPVVDPMSPLMRMAMRAITGRPGMDGRLAPGGFRTARALHTRSLVRIEAGRLYPTDAGLEWASRNPKEAYS